MLRFRYCALAVALLVTSGICSDRPSAQEDLKSEAEATVRVYEHACEQYDFAKANSMLAPGARWIEDSMPEPAEFTGDGWSKRWYEYKAAKLRIDYRVRDLVATVHGETAWVTLALDSTFTADNKAALALNENQREWRGTFVESYVLERMNGAWKVALAHTSLLPKK